jgi:CRISPR-associated protein Cas2
MLYVIAYDISNERRRRRIRQLLTDHGLREQKSVVECDLTGAQLGELLNRVQALLRIAKGDRLAVYPLCAGCEMKAQRWGADLRNEMIRKL